MRKSFRKSPFWLLNVNKQLFPRPRPRWPPPNPEKADFFSVTQKIEGPNRAYAQANGPENVRKAFLNHHLLTPKRRKQIWGVLGSARSDLVWFLAFSTKTVSVWANTKKFDSILKKRQQPNCSKRANKGRSVPGSFFWPGSFSWKITVNYLASLEFGPNKYYQIKSG